MSGPEGLKSFKYGPLGTQLAKPSFVPQLSMDIYALAFSRASSMYLPSEFVSRS